MAEIGASLREARTRARIEIAEMEAHTKIRAKYLRALENEEWELLSTGRYRKCPSLGTIRRIQALQAIGWSVPEIAKRAGIHHQHIYNLHRHATVYTSTAAAISEVYEQMAMTLPPESTTGERISATRARNHARRKGWLPPLAWTNIDDPDEHPDLTATDDLPDPVVVERILGGDFALRATKAERWEVIRRWPGSDAELEKWTGWNVARDRREMRQEVAA